MTIELLDSDTMTLQLCQGDSGYLHLRYPFAATFLTGRTVYFAFTDEKHKIIGEEIAASFVQSPVYEGVSYAKFFIPTTLTNQLKVNKNDNSQVYYWSMKMCYTDSNNNVIENTLTLKNTGLKFAPVVVLPKCVEGAA